MSEYVIIFDNDTQGQQNQDVLSRELYPLAKTALLKEAKDLNELYQLSGEKDFKIKLENLLRESKNPLESDIAKLEALSPKELSDPKTVQDILYSIRPLIAKSGSPVTEAYLIKQLHNKLKSTGLPIGAIRKIIQDHSSENEPACTEHSSDKAVLYDLITMNTIGTFSDDCCNSYISIVVEGVYRNIMVSERAKPFRDYCRRLYKEKTGKILCQDTIKNVAEQIAAEIRANGDIKKSYVRIASGKINDLYINLANSKGEAIHVTSDGWSIVENPPVFFREGAGSLPLPYPEKGGSLEPLKFFINCTDDELLLVVGFLIICFHPEGPYCVLVIEGGEGSAKTTTCFFIKSIVDPNRTPYRSLTHQEKDLFISTKSQHLLTFDNVSYIKQGQSDILCRIITGGSFGNRKLYSDDDESVLHAINPVIINGISNLVLSPDLVSRSIEIQLQSFKKDEDAKSELDPLNTGDDQSNSGNSPRENTGREYEDINSLNESFQKYHPSILGALMDLLSNALKNYKINKIPIRDRLVSQLRWVTAAFTGSHNRERFLEIYRRYRSSAESKAVSDDLIAEKLYEIVAVTGKWEGIVTELFRLLLNNEPESSSLYKSPYLKHPQALSSYLRRKTNILESQFHMDVEFSPYPIKVDGKSVRKISLSLNTAISPQVETNVDEHEVEFDDSKISSPQEIGNSDKEEDISSDFTTPTTPTTGKFNDKNINKTNIVVIDDLETEFGDLSPDDPDDPDDPSDPDSPDSPDPSPGDSSIIIKNTYSNRSSCSQDIDSKITAISLQTFKTKKSGSKLRLIGFASEKESGYYETLEPLKTILEDPSVKKIFFDAGRCVTLVEEKAYSIVNYEDAMTMNKVFTNHECPDNLLDCYKTYFDVKYDTDLHDSKHWSGKLTPAHYKYAQKNAEYILALYQYLSKKMTSEVA